MYNSFILRATAACLLILPGCAHSPYAGDRAPIFELQSKLDTTPQYHAVNARFEGYLICIEKVAKAGPRLSSLNPPHYTNASLNGRALFRFTGLTNGFPKGRSRAMRRAKSVLEKNAKVQVVTQVLYSHQPTADTRQVRLLYDVYTDGDAPKQFTDAELGSSWEQLSSEERRSIVQSLDVHLLNQSASKLLGEFANDLVDRLNTAASNAPYTHLIVLSTGWNTPVWESQANYADWQRVIQHAMAKDWPATPFRPLYIGFAWPSSWNMRVNALSFVNKARDADEIGLTWANLVVNRVIPEVLARVTVKPKLVAVGHSFGARLLTRAVNSAAAVRDESSTNKFDLFIGLEAAVSANRFIDRGNEGSPYLRSFRDRVTRYAFLASEHDSANPSAPATIWLTLTGRRKSGIYLGDSRVFHYLASSPSTRETFAPVVSVNSDGSFLPPEASTRPIWLLDATQVVRRNVYMTGGGAHSDVFNLEVASTISQLIHQASNAPAPTTNPSEP